MRLNAVSTKLVGVGLCAALAVVVGAGSEQMAVAESPHDTLTEWTIPFPDTQPLCIARAGKNILFTNLDGIEYIGRLDPESGLVTRWLVPYTPTQPGAIVVRPSDGAVFLTGRLQAEIGQVDLEAQVLRRWPLPTTDTAPPDGPSFLVMAGDGAVVFITRDTSTNAGYVGRLDTTTGNIKLWPLPDSTEVNLWQLALGPAQTVFGNFTGFGPRGLFRLDMATGGYTTWSTGSVEPAFGITADAAGRVYYAQISGSDYSISRLLPETGRVTQWRAPASFQGLGERLVLFGGHALIGNTSALIALDVAARGAESTLSPSPIAQTITPLSFTVSPIEQALVGESAQASVQVTPVRRRSFGAFDRWPISSATNAITTTTSPAAIYFNEPNRPAIGRITN